MTFATASDVQAYIPATGSPGQLNSTLISPTFSPSGAFGGDVVALTLNSDFNEAGYLQGSSSTLFGDLVLDNLPSYDSALNGLTVSQFLAVATICLSGGSCPDGLANIAGITNSLDVSFEAGTPSSFADDNLSLPGSGTPTPTPEPSSFLLLASGLASLGFFVERRRRLRRGP